jgi:hypothetical protein
VRRQLGKDRFEHAWTEERQLSSEQAIEFALRDV